MNEIEIRHALLTDHFTITIVVIGIIIPALYAVFVFVVLRRNHRMEIKAHKEMEEFFTGLRMKHANEVIEKRKDNFRHK